MVSGAIGSAAPVNATTNDNGINWFAGTTQVYRNESVECEQAIRKTFAVLYANLTASPEVEPSVSEYLQSYLGLCSPVVTLQDAFDFLIYLRFAFYAIIQISYPYPLYIDQAYPYRSVCQAFLTSNETFLAPVKYTLDLWFNATGQYTCLDYTNPIGNSFANTEATEKSWNYMQCTYLSCMSDTAFAGVLQRCQRHVLPLYLQPNTIPNRLQLTIRTDQSLGSLVCAS